MALSLLAGAHALSEASETLTLKASYTLEIILLVLGTDFFSGRQGNSLVYALLQSLIVVNFAMICLSYIL